MVTLNDSCCRVVTLTEGLAGNVVSIMVSSWRSTSSTKYLLSTSFNMYDTLFMSLCQKTDKKGC